MGTFNQIITKAIVLTVILVVFAIFYWELDPEQKDQDHRDAWNEAFIELHDRWQNGDRELFFKNKEMDCEVFKVDPNTHANFFRCNPEYLKCYYQHFPLKLRDQSFKVVFDRVVLENKPINLNTIPGVHIYLKVINEKNEVKKVLLENTCQETYIPFESEKNYFLDIFQVRIADVNRWIELKKKEYQKLVIQNPQALSHPSTNLSYKQRKEFCQDHGKTLLKRAYWEQATFYPDYVDKKLFKHPYPWTKKRSLKLKPKNLCTKIYHKGCLGLNIPFVQMSDNSVSWSGVKEVLGGYPEEFNDQMVLASSYHLDSKDKKHRLGTYQKKKSFKHPTGFRCMREL